MDSLLPEGPTDIRAGRSPALADGIDEIENKYNGTAPGANLEERRWRDAVRRRLADARLDELDVLILSSGPVSWSELAEAKKDLTARARPGRSDLPSSSATVDHIQSFLPAARRFFLTAMTRQAGTVPADKIQRVAERVAERRVQSLDDLPALVTDESAALDRERDWSKIAGDLRKKTGHADDEVFWAAMRKLGSPDGPPPTNAAEVMARYLRMWTGLAGARDRDPFESCGVSTLGLVVVSPRVDFDPDPEALETAKAMALSYQVGDLMGALAAVDEARRRFMDGRLTFDTTDSWCSWLADQLFCWPTVGYKVDGSVRASSMARVFGVDDPNLPESQSVNPSGRVVMDRLLTALDAVSDGLCRCDGEISSGLEQAVRVARRAARSHFDQVITGGLTMLTRQWVGQVNLAMRILAKLDPCAIGSIGVATSTSLGRNSDGWWAVEALVDRVTAAGLAELQARTNALAILFDWLALSWGPLNQFDLDDLLDAASLLRGSWRTAPAAPVGCEKA